MSAPAISLSSRIAWRINSLKRWINAQLARIGPHAFIAFRWPWPVRKPYMRAALTLQPRGGGLGDELMCTAVFEEIKRRNPHCRITFVTRRPDFFRSHPFIDQAVKESPGRDALWLTYHSDFVTPPPRPLISLMAECVGIAASFSRIPPPRVNPSDTIEKTIDSLPKPFIAVQPIASGWTTNKNWPLTYWKECVRTLCATYHVVELGTEPLLPAAEMGPRFTSVAGQTSLEDFVYIISQSALFIGPSSSGMHLANAFDIPALVIFGGYESPAGYDFPNVHPLYSPVECAPCWRQTCPYELKCLHAIAPAAVVTQALRLLEQSRPASQ